MEILCQIINCKFAFKKIYNGRNYNWIQIAGHAGRFKAGEREGYILKNMTNIERYCYEMLKKDKLKYFIPNINKTFYDTNENKCKLKIIFILILYSLTRIADTLE